MKSIIKITLSFVCHMVRHVQETDIDISSYLSNSKMKWKLELFSPSFFLRYCQRNFISEKYTV